MTAMQISEPCSASRGGFCRLSSGQYTADRASMTDLPMHLTNCAVQRRAADSGDAAAAIKWPVRRHAHHI